MNDHINAATKVPEASSVPPGIVTALAELPPTAHLDAAALARLLGRCKRSVQRAWRRGELPPPIKFMGKHIWLVGTILDHFQARQDAAVKAAQRRDVKISQIFP